MNFLRMMYHNLRYGAASTVIFINDQVDAALAAMVRVVGFLFLMIVIGTIAGWFGLTRVAQYIYGVNYFLGGFLSIILAARMGVLITVFPALYNALRGIVYQGTAPVPFMAPLNLPEILSNENATFIYRILWATLATLQLVSCYAVVFPVYDNPLSFLVVLGSGWLILFGALVVGIGGEWLKRYGYMNVGIGALMIICYSLTFPFPSIWINLNNRWNGLWTLFGQFEAGAQANYWVALLYFIVAVGLIVSVVYAIVKKGKGIGFAVGFAVLFLFIVILGQRTVNAITSVDPNVDFNWRDVYSGVVTTTPSLPSLPVPIPVPAKPATSAPKVIISTPSTPAEISKVKSGIFVDARSPYGVYSGMEVKAGSKIEIFGSGTAVWKNTALASPTKFEESGPNGTEPNYTAAEVGYGYWDDIDRYLCPTAKKGALIARIGDGPWFNVGSSYKGEVRNSGKLIFAINDVDLKKGLHQVNWDDNSKGYSVTVTVK